MHFCMAFLIACCPIDGCNALEQQMCSICLEEFGALGTAEPCWDRTDENARRVRVWILVTFETLWRLPVMHAKHIHMREHTQSPRILRLPPDPPSNTKDIRTFSSSVWQGKHDNTKRHRGTRSAARWTVARSAGPAAACPPASPPPTAHPTLHRQRRPRAPGPRSPWAPWPWRGRRRRRPPHCWRPPAPLHQPPPAPRQDWRTGVRCGSAARCRL